MIGPRRALLVCLRSPHWELVGWEGQSGQERSRSQEGRDDPVQERTLWTRNIKKSGSPSISCVQRLLVEQALSSDLKIDGNRA